MSVPVAQSVESWERFSVDQDHQSQQTLNDLSEDLEIID